MDLVDERVISCPEPPSGEDGAIRVKLPCGEIRLGDKESCEVKRCQLMPCTKETAQDVMLHLKCKFSDWNWDEETAELIVITEYNDLFEILFKRIIKEKSSIEIPGKIEKIRCYQEKGNDDWGVPDADFLIERSGKGIEISNHSFWELTVEGSVQVEGEIVLKEDEKIVMRESGETVLSFKVEEVVAHIQRFGEEWW